MSSKQVSVFLFNYGLAQYNQGLIGRGSISGRGKRFFFSSKPGSVLGHTQRSV
jgi:hypothetical protein